MNNGGGISFFGMLAILFIGLKLTGYIDWEWLWVLAPLWVPFALGIAIVLPYLVLARVFRSRFIAGGFSFFGMLAILFSGLKLTGYIDWEWIWVLAPLWIPFVLGIAIVLPLQVLAKVSRSRFR